MIPYLDQLNHSAATIGAVNCVSIEGGKLIGDNTDGKGFLQAVSSVRAVDRLKCVVLQGTGGAARAIAVELALAGAADLTIVNRTPARGDELAHLVRERTGVRAISVIWEGLYCIPDGTDLVVNATSIGLFPDTSTCVPVDLRTLDPAMLVCDVVPNPPRTRLIRAGGGPWLPCA